MQWFLLLALLSVLAALAAAAYFLLGRPPGSAIDEASADAATIVRTERMARALAWRVGLSIAVVLLLLLAYALGWIRPHAAPISR
jgi:hypothetical protein